MIIIVPFLYLVAIIAGLTAYHLWSVKAESIQLATVGASVGTVLRTVAAHQPRDLRKRNVRRFDGSRVRILADSSMSSEQMSAAVSTARLQKMSTEERAKDRVRKSSAAFSAVHGDVEPGKIVPLSRTKPVEEFGHICFDKRAA